MMSFLPTERELRDTCLVILSLAFLAGCTVTGIVMATWSSIGVAVKWLVEIFW